MFNDNITLPHRSRFGAWSELARTAYRRQQRDISLGEKPANYPVKKEYEEDAFAHTRLVRQESDQTHSEE